MAFLIALLLAVAGVVAAVTLPPRLRRRRRAKLAGLPMPTAHRRILERNVPLYRRMPEALREQLERHVNVFLNEKTFIGCDGQVITDEIRLTIAGHACLLLLNRSTDYFPDFRSILVYPDTYVVDETSYDGEVEIHGPVARVGESWHRGPVVLSWQDILEDIADDAEGTNVILHEFAHKLDEEDVDTEGAPILKDASHYEEWAAVLTREFAALERTVESGADSLLDDYALESPAEFFAVATEVFFERPAAMRDALPDLYGQLRSYYCVDPATWPGV